MPTRFARVRTLKAQGLVLLGALLLVVMLGAAGVVGAEIKIVASHALAAQARELRISAAELHNSQAVERAAVQGYSHTGQPTFLTDYFVTSHRAATIRAELLSAPIASTFGPSRQAWLAAGDSWQAWAASEVEFVQATGPLGSNATFDGGSAAYALVESSFAAFDAAAASGAAQADAGVASSGAAFDVAVLLAVMAAVGGLGFVAVLLFKPTLGPIRLLGQLSDALRAWDLSVQEQLAISKSMVDLIALGELGGTITRGSEQMSEMLDAAATLVTVVDRGQESRIYLHTPRVAAPATMPPLAPEFDTPGRQAQASRMAVITDLREKRWTDPLSEAGRQQGMGPAISVPMLSAGTLIGVVSCVRGADERPFTQADVHRAELLVAPLAAAVHVGLLIEDLRRTNSDLETASQHKSEFLAHMSHELRTPLNSILGFSQLLVAENYGELNARQRRYLSHIHSSGEHLLELINDVLDLSKVEAGQLELSLERVALRPVLEEALERMAPLAAEKGLLVSVTGMPDADVRADQRRLQQVLLNLLSNAIKFTPAGGRIEVSTSVQQEALRISVSDTGIGIAGEDLQRIFQEFTQVRSGRTRLQEGTGLGLALSRRLIELMGGQLEVTSIAGAGSTFSFVLPAAAAIAA